MYNNQVYQEKANIHNCKCQFMRIEAIKITVIMEWIQADSSIRDWKKKKKELKIIYS